MLECLFKILRLGYINTLLGLGRWDEGPLDCRLGMQGAQIWSLAPRGPPALPGVTCEHFCHPDKEAGHHVCTRPAHLWLVAVAGGTQMLEPQHCIHPVAGLELVRVSCNDQNKGKQKESDSDDHPTRHHRATWFSTCAANESAQGTKQNVI